MCRSKSPREGFQAASQRVADLESGFKSFLDPRARTVRATGPKKLLFLQHLLHVQRMCTPSGGEHFIIAFSNNYWELQRKLFRNIVKYSITEL